MNEQYTVNAGYVLCVKVSQATDKRAWLLLLCWKTHLISAADVVEWESVAFILVC